MNATIEKMFNDAEGRYLEPTEQSQLTHYAETLDARLSAMRALQQHEERLVERAVEEMMREHPDAASRHTFMREKAARDMTLVLRYCAMAMVRDDSSFLDQKVLHWFNTIVKAFEMSDLIESGYRALRREAREALEPAHFEALDPYLQRVIEHLS
jgi:hypothetical protein